VRVAYLLDQFPELTETFISGEIAELRRQGHAVHVESAAYAPEPDLGVAQSIDVSFGFEDRPGGRLRALAWLVSRHPLRCAADVWARRRWRREEHVHPLRRLAPAAQRISRSGAQHLHAHFAAGAALDAMRAGALLGLPYSVMTHGYDIFQTPRNLAEKLERAAFAVTPCEYSARHLRLAVPGARIHKLVMGIDGEALRRTRPHAGNRVVVAVARLTEKKGLRHLVEAAGLLGDRVDRVVIVGDGPLRDALRGPRVELIGARTPAETMEIIQQAAVLAMPCVVAADGDRDTMPLAVKEALALEVPVVASDEVGLPEVVQQGWGRLVPPGDAGALAAALDELLSLPLADRAQMGADGRAFVLEHCSRARETARLAELIARG
jgi:glycosyltransferase involved in cell wall biosynthesis